MFYRKYLLLIIFSFLIGSSAYSIPYHFSERITWNKIQRIELEEGFVVERLAFEGAYYTDIESLPKYIKEFPIHTESARLNTYLINTTYIQATTSETALLLKANRPDTSFNVHGSIVISRKEPFVRVEVLPIRWNEKKQIFEKLLSFEIVVEVEDLPQRE